MSGDTDAAEDFIENLKKMIPSWLSNMLGPIKSAISWIAKLFGFDDAIDNAIDGVKDFAMKTARPNDALVKTAMLTIVDRDKDHPEKPSIYSAVLKKHGIPADSPIATELERQMHEGVVGFVDNGMNKPLKNGYAIEATEHAKALSEGITGYLAGTSNTDPGALKGIFPNKSDQDIQAMAQQIAFDLTYYTDTKIVLANKVPPYGALYMFTKAQETIAKADADKTTLDNVNLPMNVNPPAQPTTEPAGTNPTTGNNVERAQQQGKDAVATTTTSPVIVSTANHKTPSLSLFGGTTKTPSTPVRTS